METMGGILGFTDEEKRRVHELATRGSSARWRGGHRAAVAGGKRDRPGQGGRHGLLARGAGSSSFPTRGPRRGERSH